MQVKFIPLFFFIVVKYGMWSLINLRGSRKEVNLQAGEMAWQVEVLAV